MSEKQENILQLREMDEEQQKRHYQSWETYWGRPGYGAPRYSSLLYWIRYWSLIYWIRPGYGAPKHWSTGYLLDQAGVKKTLQLLRLRNELMMRLGWGRLSRLATKQKTEFRLFL